MPGSLRVRVVTCRIQHPAMPGQHLQPRGATHRRGRPPLLFFKRLSDVWDEEYRSAFDETGDDDAPATADDRFTIPAGTHVSRCIPLSGVFPADEQGNHKGCPYFSPCAAGDVDE